MKYIIFLAFALFSFSAQAQFPGQNQGEIVSDTFYFEYSEVDSTFKRINRIDYNTGAFTMSAQVIGDSNAMRSHVARQYLEVGNDISKITQAYFNLKREERRQRIMERGFQRLFGGNIQEYISNTTGFAVIGNYRITSTVPGFILNNVNCEIVRQGNRLRLTIPGQQFFVLIIEADDKISLARGNNVIHTLFSQDNPNGRRVYRNAERTITLARRQ